MYGVSTCFAPNTIKAKKSATKIKKAILLKGLNALPLFVLKSTKGIIKIINIAENIAITPANLLGILLNIA